MRGTRPDTHAGAPPNNATPADGRELVFVLSTPRAGSTLLGAMLGSHSQVLCPPEPWLLLPLAALRDDRLMISAAYDHPFAMRGIRELVTPELLDTALAEYARSVYQTLLRTSGRSVFVDKTPRYYQILPALEALFPAALQLWIRRDPLDTLASCVETWSLPLQELLGEPGSISPYTFDVTVSLQLLLDHFGTGGSRKVTVDYEDLVQDPASHLSSICARLGLQFEPQMVNYGANQALVQSYQQATLGDKKVLRATRPHRDSVGRWRSQFSREDVRRIVTTLGTRVFERLGRGESLTAACDYARLDPSAVEPAGRLPELVRLYEEYGTASGRRSSSAEGLPSASQYTLLGQQHAQIQQAAQERLRVIQRLHSDLESLRTDLQIKEQVIHDLHAVAEERLHVIEDLDARLRTLDTPPGAPSGSSSLAELGSPGSVPAEPSGAPFASALADIRDLLERQSAAIGNVQLKIEQMAARYAELVADLEAGYDAGMQRLERELEDARAAAQARLRVIELQERALERARWLRPRLLLAQFTAPRIGQLYQYAPRDIDIPPGYYKVPKLQHAPRISVITPSLNQGVFIERTIQSVLRQQYPLIEYIVKDGCSSDDTLAIVQNYSDQLANVLVSRDSGLANGLNQGFSSTTEDILAYLNSDDILLPGALWYVADFFTRHPDVDVVYGQRVVIDEHDNEIGRWVLPPHDNDVLSWADYVPQETLFWRRAIWEKVGAYVDESFRFAIDWELLIRFRDAGARMVRLPRFLGGFRVHPHQKTSAEMAEVGVREMDRIRERCHGRPVTRAEIARALAPYLRRHFLCHKLYRLGVFKY
jgi:hypothetical protein